MSPRSGPSGTRARDGLRPKRPQHEAGMRMRAAAVVGVRHRHDAGGDRRRRAAAGAADRMVGVPRVAGGAEEARLGGRDQAELRRVGLAGDDQAGALVASRQLAVEGRHEVLQVFGALRLAHAGVPRPEVLEQEGHAGERPLREVALGRRAAPRRTSA